MSPAAAVRPDAPGSAQPPAANGPHRAGRRRRAASRVAAWWWSLPALALIAAVHYATTIAGSAYAFTDFNGFRDPEFVGLANFREILTGAAPLRALLNTVVIAVAFLVLTNVLGMAFAVALNRQLKTRYVLRTVLFAPVVLSPLAVSYVWKFLFQQAGPINQVLGAVGLESLQRTWLGDPRTVVPAIVTVMVWQHIGLTMVIYLAGLAGVPPENEEAAAMDGAGSWSRFRHVVLPALRPTILVASTMILVQGLRVFDQVQALTGGGPFGASDTLATSVYKETFVNGRFGYGSALALVMTAIVLLCALVQMLLLRERKEK
ncbi:carbohydrate ABC transporter permease [Kineococcus rhizosphaerae]|uniref:Carbohydrate ABC transporter membrane protein 1 (CUT1 family) n=1 Tax=Kineococcus rhizosphaerae TaxID=559628 RepID=A0A2T0R1J3_9ACTN|nr:sugar ABC transporter permease [Kineococcus rhizosphaerae]PRY13390.1 carbohydrate ABC transporter membrane protein 1 (CUT1 family) [Kineococcus rhizosphaerae]